MARAAQSIDVAVPLDAFWEVLLDYASYPQFVPELRAAKAAVRDDGAVEVTYWLDVKLKVFEFTLLHRPDRARRRIDWKLVRGGEFMRANSGSWQLEEAGAGTRARYEIEIDFGPLVPKSFEKQLAERGLPGFLQNFKARAESIQQR